MSHHQVLGENESSHEEDKPLVESHVGDMKKYSQTLTKVSTDELSHFQMLCCRTFFFVYGLRV